MALGTVTQQVIDPHLTQASSVAVGDVRLTVTNVVGEASYTTGGPVVTAAQLGLNTILFAQAEILTGSGANATSNAMSVIIQPGGGSAKLQCWSNAQAEIVSTTNVSGVTWQILALGY